MKTTHRIWLACLPLIGVLQAGAQKLPNKQEVSLYLPNDVKIDGLAREWNNQFKAHNNAVDVLYCSAKDYYSLKGLIEITLSEPMVYRSCLLSKWGMSTPRFGPHCTRAREGVKLSLFKINSMKLAILYLTVFFFINVCKSQSVEVVLKKKIDQSNFVVQAPPTEEDTSPLVVPAFVHLKYFYRYSVSIATIEEAFRNMKSGTITELQFKNKVRSLTKKEIDTNILITRLRNYTSSITHIISGVDEDGNKLFLVDINRDNRISQDEVFSYKKQFIDSLKKNSNLRDSLKSFTLSQIGKDGSSRSLSFKINPLPYFNDYASEQQKQTAFGLIRNEFWEGNQTIRHRSYKFLAGSKQFSNELNDLQFNISDDSIFNRVPIQTKQEWVNKDISLFVDSAWNAGQDVIKLKISYQSPPLIHKDTSFSMVLANVANGRSDAFLDLLNKGKYILIDYWGTWCVPCIEKIPILKEIQGQFQQKMTLVSIAYDYDISVVKHFDDEHKTTWSSYFIDRNKQQELIRSLKVVSFPTYRLYNEQGKLVASGDSEKDLIKIKDILSKKMPLN